MRTFWPLLLMVLLVPAVAVAQDDEEIEETENEEPAKKDDGPFSKGKWDVRGGIDLDLNRTINLGGDNSGDTFAGGGLRLGIGYFILSRFALDLDTRIGVQFSPETKLDRVQTTPGVRWHPVDQVYVRAGAPIAFVPEFGLGVLGGVGYRQPLGSRAAFVLGVDYTYWLTEAFQQAAPGGQLEFHAGVTTSF